MFHYLYFRSEGDVVQGESHSGSSKKVLLQSHSTDNADIRPIRPIQRPTPRKPPPGPGAIPPPPHSLPDDLSGKHVKLEK